MKEKTKTILLIKGLLRIVDFNAWEVVAKCAGSISNLSIKRMKKDHERLREYLLEKERIDSED